MRRVQRVPAHAISSLLIAGRAKQAFRQTMQFAIARSSGRSEIVHDQQRIFRLKSQPLYRASSRGEVARQMAGVHDRAEVLLAERGQRRFEHSRFAYQKDAEINSAERSSIHRCQQRESDMVRCQRQKTQTVPNRAHPAAGLFRQQ